MMEIFKKIYYSDKTHNFHLLFWPSFILPLIEIKKNGKEAVKKIGFCKGLVMRELKNYGYYVTHESRECIDYAKYLLGKWFSFEQIEKIIEKSNLIRHLHQLLQIFRNYGIAVSPRDDIEVFITIFLSQNTEYHINTVKWVKKILDTFDIRRKDLIDQKVIAEKIGRSYQLLRLPEALKCYLDRREKILRGSHKLLLDCPYVGPKIYFAYRLHVLLDLTVAPVDVNLYKYLLKYAPEIAFYKRPIERYCRVFECEKCPIKDSCIESILRREYSVALGWIQTVVYVYNDLLRNKNIHLWDLTL
ncbi:MAG: hypothetical protein ACP5I7_03430 [Sulfolobales archaeon]